MPFSHKEDLLKTEKLLSFSGFGNVNEQKSALRKFFKEKRQALSEQKKSEYAESLYKKVISLDAFKNADALLSFFPLENETDVHRINREALRLGKILAFPKCVKNTREMNFYSVRSLDELEKGSFSIFEPKESCPLFIPSDKPKAVCLVPALAYDREGFRIGYGGGYYDRYLSKYDVYTVGVIYSPFITESLPRDELDIAVDSVVIG